MRKVRLMWIGWCVRITIFKKRLEWLRIVKLAEHVFIINVTMWHIV